MDFDVGNIFYVVITLVAIIVGLLGKKKKPAGQGTGEDDSRARPGFMENFEKILRMGEENPGVVDLKEYEDDLQAEADELEEVSEHVPQYETQSRTILEDYERIMRSDSGMDLDNLLAEGGSTTEPIEVVDMDQERYTDYFQIVKDFDAGTAVVYSAIINRVDY